MRNVGSNEDHTSNGGMPMAARPSWPARPDVVMKRVGNLFDPIVVFPNLWRAMHKAWRVPEPPGTYMSPDSRISKGRICASSHDPVCATTKKNSCTGVRVHICPRIQSGHAVPGLRRISELWNYTLYVFFHYDVTNSWGYKSNVSWIFFRRRKHPQMIFP